MKVLQKWNPKYRKYEPFISKGKDIILFTPDLSKIVNCTNCSKRVEFGDTYTSRFIHSPIGLGYPVCTKGYNKERELEKKYE